MKRSSRANRRRRFARSSFASTASSGSQPLQRSRVRIEALEQRCLLSADFGYVLPGTGAFQHGHSVAADASGNVFMIADNRDVAKYDPQGNLLWFAPFTATLPFNETSHIALDQLGNVYISGTFTGASAIFGSTILPNGNFSSAFVAKLNSSGVFQWAKNWLGVGGNNEGYGLAADASGNVYLAGAFNTAVSTGGGPAMTSSGPSDALVVKYDTNGNFLWGKQVGGSWLDEARGVAVDGVGNVYVTGSYSQSADLDPGGGVANRTGSIFGSEFLLKLNSSGNLLWADASDDPSNLGTSAGMSVAVDSAGNVYTAGVFSATADLDPSLAGVDNLSSSNFTIDDYFVRKVNASGQFQWVRQMHESTNAFNVNQSISVDAAGNVYATGSFQGTADFNWGRAPMLLTSAGSSDAYIWQLDPDGNVAWVHAFGSTSGDGANGIAVNSANEIFLTGFFAGTVDFDPSAGSQFKTSSFGTSFLLKLTQASINGLAFNDRNLNGVRDQYEPALAGVAAMLYQSTDATVGNGDDALVASTTTNSAGRYQFIGVGSGNDYYVKFREPDGFDSFSPRHVGANRSLDSDVDASGATGMIPIVPQEVDVEDAGLIGASPSFGFAIAASSGAAPGATAVATDLWGNVYYGGMLDGTADFDPGAGVYNLTGANAAFIAKYTPAGALLWAQAIAVNNAQALTSLKLDGAGNVYAMGLFSGTVDFDPGLANFTLASDLAQNPYALKLDNQGKFVWARELVSGTVQAQVALAVNETGEVYVTGAFTGSANFNPGGATAEILASAGGYDAFVLKLDADGTFLWVKKFGGAFDDAGAAVALDNSGNLVLAGSFTGSATFTQGFTNHTLTGASAPNTTAFVLTLDADGNYLWSTALVASTSSAAAAVATDALGSVYVTGGFAGSSTFGGSIALQGNAYLVALDNLGDFAWANAWGDPLDPTSTILSRGVALDSSGEIYLTGSYTGTVDFDPGTGVTNLTSLNASADAYVLKLSSVGSFLSIASGGGDGADRGNAIAVAAGGNVYSAGLVTGSGNFNPAGTPYNIGQAGSVNAYLWKLSPAVNVAPSFTPGPDQTVGEGSGAITAPGWASNISAGPPRENGQSLEFIVNNDNASLFVAPPAIDPGTGALTYTLVPLTVGVAHVTVKLQDSGGTANGGLDTSPERTFTINVVPINHAPSFTAGASQIVNEDSGAHAVNGWASSISSGPGPADVGQNLDFIVSNDNNSLFSVQPSIDALTGNLSYTLAPDANGVANVTVQLHDDGGTTGGGVDTSAPQSFTITVNSINDAPSFVPGASQTVNEDAGAVSVPAWAKNISPGPATNEAGQTLSFVFVSNDNPGLFSVAPAIDPATGTLTYTVAPNSDGIAHLSVRLQDDGGTANGGVNTSPTQNFTITVNFVNDAPSFAAGGNVSVVQNTGPAIFSGWASGMTPGPGANEAGQTIAFNIINDNNGLFSVQPAIDAFTGTLTFTPATDAFGTASVTVALQDNGGVANGGVDTSTAQTFTITVTPINRAPSFDPGPNVTSLEDGGNQSFANWAVNISTGDPPQINQTLNFIVTNDNNSLFSTQPAIDPSTGTLAYALAANVSGTANVTVQLHDNGGTANGGVDMSAPQTFTISVLPVNDKPSFFKGANQSALEGSGAHTVGGWATVISPGPGANEAAQTLNFIVTNDNNSLFAVQPAIAANGSLTYTLAPFASGTATVSVQLHDNGGTANGGVDTSATQTFTISAQFVNQAPTFELPSTGPTVLEDSGAATMLGWATNIGPGPGNGDAGQTVDFIVTNSNNALFDVQPVIDPATGNLTFAVAPNASGTATVSVQLHDNGGTANGGSDTSPAQTFTIVVLFVNEAPSFVAGPNQTVNENTAAHVVAPWATNISPGAGADEAGQTLSFIVSNDNNGLFSVQPAVDRATGALSYTLAPFVSGTANVSVLLLDDGGTANGGVDASASQSFTITVNLVNSAPSFTKGADQTVNENAGPQVVSGWATNISPGLAAAEAQQSLNFLFSNDNNALFSVPPSIDSSGTLTYTPAPNASGLAHVAVRLHDNGGTANGGVDTSPVQAFTINVNFVNDAPSFTAGVDQVVDQDSGAHVVPGWARNITPGPGLNEAAQALNFIVTNDNNSLFSVQPAVDSSGTLTYTLQPGVVGAANVAVTLHDNGGTANGGADTSPPQSFAIAVNHVNHAPTVVNALANRTLNEDAADVVIGLAGVFDDADIAAFADAIAYSVGSNDNPGLLSASVSGSNLTLHLAPNRYGTAHLAVRAADTLLAAVDDLITVTVNPVNDPPSFTAGPPQLVNVNAGLVTVPNWATNVSPGPNESGQSISFTVTNDNNSLFFIQPALSANGTLTFTLYPGSFGSAHVTVVAHDNGGTANGGVDASAPQTFLIQVKAPPVATGDSYVLSATTTNVTLPTDGVIANDTNPYGDVLTTRLVTKPAHGTVTFNADGTFTYAKGPDFQGLDKFSYKLIDGTAASNVATVRLVSYQAATVRKVYEQVLHRDPDDAGLQYWTNRIQNGEPYSVVAQGVFESNERLDPIIQQYYQQFLLRTADAQGIAFWRDQVWKRDGGPENVVAGMISSQEFFQSAGGTNAGWVAELYRRLLNRPADSQGLQFWTNALNQRQMTTQQVVLGFLRSDENFVNLIDGFFQTYLQRDPNASELANYLQQMRSGASQRDVQLSIISSAEYRNTPTPPAAGSMIKLS